MIVRRKKQKITCFNPTPPVAFPDVTNSPTFPEPLEENEKKQKQSLGAVGVPVRKRNRVLITRCQEHTKPAKSAKTIEQLIRSKFRKADREHSLISDHWNAHAVQNATKILTKTTWNPSFSRASRPTSLANRDSQECTSLHPRSSYTALCLPVTNRVMFIKHSGEENVNRIQRNENANLQKSFR